MAAPPKRNHFPEKSSGFSPPAAQVWDPDNHLTAKVCLRRTFAPAMKPVFYLFLLVFSVLFAACEKEESPVTLPPPTGAQYNRVTMGEEYTTQIFWDLETNSPVKSSSNDVWDLGFESGSEGWKVWMNGGKGINLYNTHKTAFEAVTALPAGLAETSWGFDDPKGQFSGNYVGSWWDVAAQQSKEEVFIARVGDFDYYKIQLLRVDETAYTFRTGRLGAADGTVVTLPKEAGFNRVYYSFETGPVAQPDPPQATWDFVFTRYRYIYYDYLGPGLHFPYLISGVLLNPYKVTAGADSNVAFSERNLAHAQAAAFTNNTDVIGGFSWKVYDFDKGRYDVNPRIVYYVRTRNGQLYKLHFLDFYLNGVKGSPSFESERLE